MRRGRVLLLGLVAAAAFYGLAGLLILEDGDRDDPTASRRPREGGAEAPGPGPSSSGAPTLAGASPSRAAGDPVEGVPLLAGRVLDAKTRRGVAGAHVRAWAVGAPVPEETRTDADGRFRLAGTAGRATAFHLVVGAEGYARAVERRAIPSREPLTLLLARGGFVEGRLVEAATGRPVVGASVRLFRATFQPGEEVSPEWETREAGAPAEVAEPASPVSTDSDGRFRLGPALAGLHVLLFRREGEPPFTHQPVVVPEEGRVDVGDVEAPSVASFVTRILDARSGEPLAGVEFLGRSLLDGRDVQVPVRPREVRSDGVYVLPSLHAPGRSLDSTLVAAREGYGAVALGPVVETEGDAYVFRLVPNATVRGDVRDDDGTPVAGALVSVRRDVDRGLVVAGTTDREGRFAFQDLPAVVRLELLVQVATEDRVVTMVPLNLAPGEDRTISVGGASGPSLRGVVRAWGSPVVRALVAVDGPSGERTIVYTDSGGRYRVDGLSEGEHEVYVGADPTGVRVTRRVLLEGHAARTVDLDLQRRIRGTVLLDRVAGAEPREPPDVVVRSPEGVPSAWLAEGMVGPEGRFEVLLPEAGPCVLDVAEEGWYVPEPLSVDTRAADVEGLTLRVVEDPGSGVVEVRLRDAETGAPVPDAGYRYAHRQTSGSGTVSDDGVLRDDRLGFGRHRYVFDAPEHVAQDLEVELTPGRGEVTRDLLLVRSEAVRIVGFAEPSPGREAGLQVGDLVLRHGERATPTTASLAVAVRATSSRDRVRLELLRGGVPLSLTVLGGRLGVRAVNARR